MSDYISREAFIADCEGRYCAPCKEQGKDVNGVRCRVCWVDDMLGEVMDAPAADVAEVMHGRWISDAGFYCCSRCEYEWEDSGYKTPFCPDYGAKMDLDWEILDPERSGKEGNSDGI